MTTDQVTVTIVAVRLWSWKVPVCILPEARDDLFLVTNIGHSGCLTHDRWLA